MTSEAILNRSDIPDVGDSIRLFAKTLSEGSYDRYQSEMAHKMVIICILYP